MFEHRVLPGSPPAVADTGGNRPEYALPLSWPVLLWEEYPLRRTFWVGCVVCLFTNTVTGDSRRKVSRA